VLVEPYSVTVIYSTSVMFPLPSVLPITSPVGLRMSPVAGSIVPITAPVLSTIVPVAVSTTASSGIAGTTVVVVVPHWFYGSSSARTSATHFDASYTCKIVSAAFGDSMKITISSLVR